MLQQLQLHTSAKTFLSYWKAIDGMKSLLPVNLEQLLQIRLTNISQTIVTSQKKYVSA